MSAPGTGEGNGGASLQPGQPFNPYRLFYGVLIPDVLVRYRGINPTAKFVWGRLYRYSGEDGRVFPAVPTIAKELGLSDREVQRGLAALERNGLIRRILRKSKRGDYTSTEYEFLFHPLFTGACGPAGARQTPGSQPKAKVVSDVSLGDDSGVTTNTKRRLEAKTSSSPSAPFSPSPTPSPKPVVDDEPKSERAELIELIRGETGEAPDQRLVRDITKRLELHRISLREYLDDIKPRLRRLRRRARAGFFHQHATLWLDSRPADRPAQPVSIRRCPACRGCGRISDGYCVCAMGVELERSERRRAARKAEHGDSRSVKASLTRPRQTAAIERSRRFPN